ncbi:phage tail sheath subtilisin-like domain-containing protein [Neomegalonema sp.]|uniref:phage tail sheath subtilisin-like domain-containing protein n=1 Tax=Neomegalonema sp. TaxID=2039713 RepID=UPI002628344E|nr:phage tail sheath subtilisin-like domain-containing protein [Neomegalonema sp.]MDD2870127.1 phage tail sheath subtilisin-like domain-containing protein [Neomegalonema sp.]
MAANFLHGVETIEIDRGPRPVSAVKTAVVGLVGTAPIFEVDGTLASVNRPVLIQSDRDAARHFGTRRAGFTIPQALNAIFAQGRGVAIVVNVFDPGIHAAEQAPGDVTFAANGRAELGREGVFDLVLTNSGGTVTYVAGTDFALDPGAGVATRLEGGAIAVGATVRAAFRYADLSRVTPASVVGAVDAAGNRTGLQALLDCHGEMGFWPKILIAPGFGALASVSAELDVMAQKLRAVALIDAPIGASVAQVVAGRGPSGAVNFNLASERSLLCYPHVKVADDSAQGGSRLEPLSQYCAGVICAVDLEEGYWVSPSNHEIKGIVGIERRLSAMINDPSADVNRLNEAGIVTVFNAFGSGLRLWGNRPAAWPSVTHPKNFIPVRRVADMLHESVEQAMLQFLDRPINQALIDDVRETVNAFIRTLIGRGALIDGRCLFDPGKNEETQIAAGHLVFDIEFMPPTPAERISFESFINIALLGRLRGGQ